jgi:HAD superfamily hydrolase (TIGR01549 family)
MTPKRLTTFSAVLFDIDGTLVDSNEQHVQAWAAAFKRHGYEIPDQAVRKQIWKGADQLVPTLVPGIESREAKAIAKVHDEVFKSQYLQGVRPFAAATEILARVRDMGLKVALASSAKREEVEHYTRLLGAERFVDAATSADDVEQSKPAGDIFASALAKLGDVPGDRALVVGDTPYDVSAARKCKIATIALLSGGFDERELLEAGAVEVYADVSALLDAISPTERVEPISELP